MSRAASGQSSQLWYVDVAAVRIQTWLGRSASLRLRRGASYALASVTSKDEVSRLTGLDPFEWTPDAGEISGVVPLRVVADGMSEEAARTRATSAAHRVAEHIRRTLPTCPLVATWGRGASYVEAYVDMTARARAGDILLDLAGDSDEMPLARACEGCRQARAAWTNVRITDKDDLLALCPDCAARFARAGRSKVGREELKTGASLSLLPSSQRDLVEGLNKLIEGLSGEDQLRSLDRFPKDFADMAERADRRAGDSSTQLALIFADGNGIGALMKHWAVERRGRAALDQTREVPKDHIVKALDTSTKQSIVGATRSAFSRWVEAPIDPETKKRPAPPVLVHVAGGDDVMVSVPASHAWAFARALADEFTNQCRTVVPDGASSPPLLAAFGDNRLPTLSIGMVFHHLGHPFSDVVEKAEHQLAHAKGATQVLDAKSADQPGGPRTDQGPSVPPATLAFHDLTADGEMPPLEEPGTARRPVTIRWLADQVDPLARLASASRSHRSTLLQLLRESRDQTLTSAGSEPTSTLAAGRQPEDPANALARRVVEVGSTAVLGIIRALSPDLASDEDVQVALEKRRELRDDLRLCLDIARHWPTGIDETVPKPRALQAGLA